MYRKFYFEKWDFSKKKFEKLVSRNIFSISRNCLLEKNILRIKISRKKFLEKNFSSTKFWELRFLEYKSLRIAISRMEKFENWEKFLKKINLRNEISRLTYIENWEFSKKLFWELRFLRKNDIINLIYLIILFIIL